MRVECPVCKKVFTDYSEHRVALRLRYHLLEKHREEVEKWRKVLG
ncbi:MAG: hypothetical protein QXT64_04775 [Desulfurococcaceae archaeon]